jgi:hypothetical protein
LRIPQNFKTAIKKHFYDKEISLYSTEEVVDADGGANLGTLTVTSTFLGNINFSKLDKVQKDYGIDDQIDAVITTDSLIDLDSIVGYDSRKYRVIRSIPFDSHTLLIVKLWSSPSETSPSA